MPKSCAIPECKRSEGKRESYYKFPLQDKVRLKQWLTNMNLENFFPTKNQHLCSKHFKPSCFKVRWGVRLLKLDAVPSIFPFAGGGSIKKRPARVKMIHLSPNPKTDVELVSLPCSDTETRPHADVMEMETETVAIALNPNFSAEQVFIGAESLVKNIALPNTAAGAVNLVPLVHIVESFDGLSLALATQTQGLSPITLPFCVTEDPQIREITLSQPITFITEEQIASTSLQHDLYSSEAVLSPQEEVPTIIDGTLVIEDVSIDPFSDCGFQTVAAEQMSAEEVVSYLETIQTVTAVPILQPCPLPPLMPSTETILSTAITAPISSIVPIVSKHATLVSEILLEEEEIDLEEEIVLPESLTTPELLSIAADLQKKVRTLQQRNRRHTSKLEILEGVVEQLKKENIISDDELSFLEVACVQPSAGSPETNTFTIVCQEDDQTLLYTLPLQVETETQTLLLRSVECDEVVSV